MAEAQNTPPLVVDLDGTLVHSDLLIESAFALARQRPAALLRAPWWLRAGRARLKSEFAARARLGVAALPYNEALLDYLRAEKAGGRTLVLATAANRRYAEQVAAHLELFDAVLASDAATNLDGEAKLAAIRAQLGDVAFDYAGDADVDRVVWRAARRAIVVNASAGFEARVRRDTDVEQRYAPPAAGWRVWARALRVHQWLKNALVFVPLLAAHEFTDPGALALVVLAFVAFSLLASSVYILNDLVDLDDDRRHPTKRERPFAAGRLPVAQGVLAIPVLLIAAFAIALVASPPLAAILAIYYGLTLTYSLALKQIVLIDVLTLAALYTLRVVAGGAVVTVPLSFWLLALSMSIFLSLAMAKRCTELLLKNPASQTSETGGQALLGRGYQGADLAALRSLGTAAGYASVVVMALYINSQGITDRYSHPERIWLLCPVLVYWISRIWLVTLRGHMHDDPLVFAARDTGSRLCVALGAVIMMAAL